MSPDGGPLRIDPIRASRTFEAAIEHIIEAIERGRLRAGDRLPNEAELAAALEISRPTLRQALRVLEGSGLVIVRRGAGGGVFVVSDLVPGHTLWGLVALEEEVVIDVLRARRVLEGAVVRHVAEVADDDAYTEIERTVDLLRDNLGIRSHVMRADAMFHRAVVRAARNPQLQLAMRGIGRQLAPLRDAYSGGLEQDQKTLDVHTRQLAAMRARDEAELDRVLDEHFGMLEQVVAAARGDARSELFGMPG